MTFVTRCIVATCTLTLLTAFQAVGQDEIYLEITSPGLRRVAVAAPPLMVMPKTPADVAQSFQSTLDEDLAAAFQPLADWKTKKGVRATIVTTAWIVNIVPAVRIA